MVIPGSDSKNKSNSEEIAKKTLDCLKKNVPSEVTGIAFYLEANLKLRQVKILMK